jgi:hypothetical protein
MSSGPTGPTGEGPTGPVYILTIAQLEATASALQAKENADRQTLGSYMAASEGLSPTNPIMLRWVGAGFPDGFVVASTQVNPPGVCVDGVTRGVYDYVSYLLGADLTALVGQFQASMLGISVAYSISGTTLSISVSRL